MDIKQEEKEPSPQQHQQAQKMSFPGDVVFNLDTIATRTLFLGPGVRKQADHILATRSGFLRYRPPSTFFLETSDDSYVPATGDDVVGVVVRRRGQEVLEQYYVVDFGKNTGRQTGVLPILAFKGATKRYRPNLKKGDLVYCRIRKTTVDGPVRLTCTSNNTKEQFWGPLRRTGALYRAKLSFVRRCLTEGSPEHSMILEVGTKFPFESAVGLNGRIWLYTGFEKSQNFLYLLFRDVEQANGDLTTIKKITGRFLQEVAALGEDIPVEDNTQYWVTRVA